MTDPTCRDGRGFLPAILALLAHVPARSTAAANAVRIDQNDARAQVSLYRVPLIRTRAPIGAIRWT